MPLYHLLVIYLEMTTFLFENTIANNERPNGHISYIISMTRGADSFVKEMLLVHDGFSH